MKRFIEDFKKHYKYSVYSAKSELKSEIANSHLSWLWWILDPLLFMMVYTFISVIVFRTSEPYFPVFVFIGLSSWKFFEKTVKQSVKLVSSNSSIVSKVYLPKHILIFVKMYANGFKMAVSFVLVVIMMFVYRVPASFFGPDPLNLLGVVILTSLGTWGLPQMVQKFYAIKSEEAIDKGTVISTLFAVVVSGGCYFLGGFGLILIH